MSASQTPNTKPNPKTETYTLPPTTLSSPPGTDIWRKPPMHNVFTAPTHPCPLPKYSLKRFCRARLTLTLPPATQLRQYDQAGLVLRLTKRGMRDEESKWLKTGVEFYNGMPYISTVGCDAWADWSVVPMTMTGVGSDDVKEKEGITATVEVKRENDALGRSLWVYFIQAGQSRPVREVNWFFAHDDDDDADGDGDWSVEVGAYVARPTTQEGGTNLLDVVFGGGEVEVRIT